MSMVPWRRKQREPDTWRHESPLAAFREEMYRLFDRFWREPFGDIEPFGSWFGGWGPALDVSETAEEICVRAELPGVAADDLEISVSGDVLTLRGEKKQETEEKGRGYHRVERRFGDFQRSVPLPASVDRDKVEAAYRDGVLTIRLPKKETAKPKRIEVKYE